MLSPPFILEDAVRDGVAPSAMCVNVVSDPAFLGHAVPGKHVLRCNIHRGSSCPDSVQSETIKPELQEKVDELGAKSCTPVISVQSESDLPCRMWFNRKPRRPDQLIGLVYHDSQGVFRTRIGLGRLDGVRDHTFNLWPIARLEAQVFGCPTVPIDSEHPGHVSRGELA